jgi:CBS domain-containing protein
MIVRIMAEGQYEVDAAALDEVRHADEALLHAVETGDQAGYAEHLDHLLRVVRQGRRLAPDSLQPSDLVVPGPDMSVDEARRLMEQHQL